MSRKVAATKSRKVAATKSSKTILHKKNSQAETMLQLTAAAKPHACCLFAAIHCEKPIISIRVESAMLHAKFQDHRTSRSGEEYFLRFLPYMVMVAILVM